MKKAISLFLILIVLSTGISIPNKAMAQEEPWCQISATSKVESDGALRIDVRISWTGGTGVDWNVLYIDGSEWTGWQGTDGTTPGYRDWFPNAKHELRAVINLFSGPQAECHKNIDPAESGSESLSVPACGISIPSGSVVGQFTTNTLLYWAVQDGATTEAMVRAGQTAWTTGVNGNYRQVVWSCQYLWVPLNTMGPNYDSVWNGTPLPTGAVQ
jgi:hypothetical protein